MSVAGPGEWLQDVDLLTGWNNSAIYMRNAGREEV
jgi:hypothetical protein